jgi:phosphopantothenoylcysteine decarboxylase / phosphopantothenate---cysteine ligase
VMEHLTDATVVVGAAAVADFRMASVGTEKLRREGSLHLDLEPTEDILRGVVDAHRPGTLVIAFAAETDASIGRARQKLVAKGADAIVLNDISQPGVGFDSDLNAATFITREHAIDIPEMTKREMADHILDQIAALRVAAPATKL